MSDCPVFVGHCPAVSTSPEVLRVSALRPRTSVFHRLPDAHTLVGWNIIGVVAQDPRQRAERRHVGQRKPAALGGHDIQGGRAGQGVRHRRVGPPDHRLRQRSAQHGGHGERHAQQRQHRPARTCPPLAPNEKLQSHDRWASGISDCTEGGDGLSPAAPWKRPSHTMRHRSAAAATSGSWVTTTTVRPRSRTRGVRRGCVFRWRDRSRRSAHRPE